MKKENVCKLCGKVTEHKKYCSFSCRVEDKKSSTCLSDGCDRLGYCHRYCSMHYNRIKKYGSPLSDIKPAYRGIRVVYNKKQKKHNKKCPNCLNTFHSYIKKQIFCSKDCKDKHRTGPFVIASGYKKLLVDPRHHRACKDGYVFEHILILERKLDRMLRKGEVCHHLDGNRLNNSIDNLVACKNNAEHLSVYHYPKTGTKNQ